MLIKSNSDLVRPIQLIRIYSSIHYSLNSPESESKIYNVALFNIQDYIYMKLEPRIQEAIRQNEDTRKQRIDEART